MKNLIEKTEDSASELLKSVIACACLLLALGSHEAFGQAAGTYSLFGTTGLTNLTSIPINTTNTFFTYATNGAVANTNTFSSPGGILSANTNLLMFNVSEFDYCSITFGLTGTATSTNSLLAYPSYDNGATFAAVPILQYLNIAPGAAAFITNSVPDIHGVTHLAFVLRSTGTTPGTNALGEITFKSNKVATRQATH
jgi:hypothetical protein